MNRIIAVFLAVIISSVFILPRVRALLEDSSLIISEILANPVGDDTLLEWIEIENVSNTDQNVENWTLQGKQLPSFTVRPGEFLIIVKNEQSFLSTFQTQSSFIRSDFSLSNAGGELLLQKLDNTQKSIFTYENSSEGKSFERLIGNCGLIKQNVTSHTLGLKNTTCDQGADVLPTNISPTVTYSTAETISLIAITSLMPNPESGEEWIEIQNISDNDVNLSGYKFVDKSQKTFMLQEGILKSKESLKVYPKTISLNNEGDTIILLDGSSKRVDLVVYGESLKGTPFVFFQNPKIEEEYNSLVMNTPIPTLSPLNPSGVVKSTDYNHYFKIPIYYESKDLQ